MTLVVAQYGQGGPEVMRAEERDVAAPAATQVEIEQKAIGFNYFDVLQRRGSMSDDEPGRVMGIEGAGVVTAIGADVTDFAVGGPVGYLRSQGAYAATRLMEADLLFPLPKGISFEAAAALTVKGFTAWLCSVQLFEVQPGQTVLVTTAAGGVGSLTARLAAYRGGLVIGAVGSEAKRALAHESGAGDVAVGLDEAIELVARLTDGNGVDVVFDGIGADTANRLLDAGTVRSGGTIISSGASGGWPRADPDAIARRGATVVVPQVPNYIKTAAELRAGMAEVFALYLSGAFGEISPARYPLREAATLHAQVESRAASGISVLVP
ncbi:zinc-binding dehydrogenase [Sphingomonas endolithica]|uniref:zinc-binding dehydrogenase n=1 Tax=Sphingomonas endolithica TaxID=2972485 RepID=UPI0021AF02F7|nr:zinc-binding dehydrogenase [Sphingomonas sp. ZFBP2030]